jgi:hypothetical protein
MGSLRRPRSVAPAPDRSAARALRRRDRSARRAPVVRSGAGAAPTAPRGAPDGHRRPGADRGARAQPERGARRRASRVVGGRPRSERDRGRDRGARMAPREDRARAAPRAGGTGREPHGATRCDPGDRPDRRPVAIDDLLPALENRDLAADTSIALSSSGIARGGLPGQLLAQAPPNLLGAPARSSGATAVRATSCSCSGRRRSTAGGVGALQGSGSSATRGACRAGRAHGEPQSDARAGRERRARDPHGHHEKPTSRSLRNRWTDWWASTAATTSGCALSPGTQDGPGLLVDRSRTTTRSCAARRTTSS